MAWILDTYRMLMGGAYGSPVTGKPVIVGGTAARRAATGSGVAHLTRLICRRRRVPKPVRVAIAGFGEVGQAAAETLSKSSEFRLVAASDIGGGRLDVAGLDVPQLLTAAAKGSVVAAQTGELAGREEVLEADCDVLIPASVASVITETNAARIKARFVVEAANGPITLAADRLLAGADVVVIPDILANAGGVIASYFEAIQEANGTSFSDNEFHQRVSAQLDTAWRAVMAIAIERNISLRDAAMVLAVQRVAEAHETRGLYP